MRSILMITAVLWSSFCYGQVITNPGTVESSRLHGQADVIRSQGDYLEGLGQYEKDHEVARDLYLKNKKQYIRDRWEIQDDYARRYYDSSKRIIRVPDPSKTRIGYNGKYYRSWSDLKADKDAMAHMQFEADKREMRREIIKAVEAEKDKEAIAFLRKWDKMGFAEKQRLKGDREFREAAPDLWYQKHHPQPITAEERAMLRIYGYGS